MAALTGPRNTPRMGGDIHPYDFPVAASGKGWQGGIGCINTSGLLVPGAATATPTLLDEAAPSRR